MSTDLLLGLLVGVVPAILALIVWVARNQLGLFARRVTWATTYQLNDRVSGSLPLGTLSTFAKDPDAEVTVGASWVYVFLVVPKGTDPVRNLSVHFDSEIIHWDCQPKMVGSQVVENGRSTVLLPSVEPGRYLMCASKLSRYGEGISIAGVNADNVGCRSKRLSVELEATPRWVVALNSANIALWVFLILSFLIPKAGGG